MRVLKVFCVLVCLFSVGRFVVIIHGVFSDEASLIVARHGISAAVLSLVIALVAAVEFYGIHKKASFAWKLGWGMLAATFLQFLVLAGSAALGVPDADYPWVAFAGVMVDGSLVALYWGFWWKRQKGYFTSQSPASPSARTKELVAVLCIAASAFAAIALFAAQTAKYREPADPAVKQFHERLAAGQYVAIYDEADETLRRTTSESDFVNLLQSVHQKLGDAQNLNLRSTVISWHGNGKLSIGVTYDTEFTYGAATEQFVWQEQDNRVALGRYQIRSKVLTPK
jgi:hypothetical protein